MERNTNHCTLEHLIFIIWIKGQMITFVWKITTKANDVRKDSLIPLERLHLSQAHTEQRQSKATNTGQGQGTSPPLSVTVLSGVGDRHFHKVTIHCNSYLCLPRTAVRVTLWKNPSLQMYIQLKSTFILYTCSIQPGSDAVTDLVPSYRRTSNFIFFFSSSISTIVYLHLYTTLFTEHPL